MDEVDLLDYWYMICSRWRLVVLIAALFGVVTAVYMFTVPSIYRATTTIIFPSQGDSGSSVLSQLTGIQSLGGGQTPGTYSQILKSRTLRSRVVKDLGMDKLNVEPDALEHYLQVLSTRDGGLEIVCNASTGWFENIGRAQAKDRAARLAADMADTYARELQAYDQTSALNEGHKKRIFIEGELEKTKSRLSDAEEAFKRFRERNPAVIPVDQSTADFTELADLRAKQLSAEAEREEVERRLEKTSQVFAKEDREILSSRVLTDNPIITDLRSKLVDAEIRRAKLLEDVTEKHPSVVSIDQEIAKIRDKMAGDLKERITNSETLSTNPVYQNLQNQIVSLQVDRTGLQSREAALQSVIQKVEQRLTQSAGKQLQYVRLMRDVKAFETVYTTLLAEYSKAQINEAREADNFQVLDWAEVPKLPVSPRRKLLVSAALLVGLMLGSFVAIVRESTRTKNRKVGKPAVEGLMEEPETDAAKVER